MKWYLVIIFFPLIGSIIYLYYKFSSRTNLDNVSDVVEKATTSNYKIKRLQKALSDTDSVKNRVMLADEYVAVQEYQAAIKLYTSCLEGVYQDDPGVLRKLIEVTFLTKDYKQAIAYGDTIKNDILFKKSEERVAYAWAFYFDKQPDKAEEQFKGMDSSFENYMQRLEYAKFLHLSDRGDDCKSKLEDLIDEIDSMHRQEKRSKNAIYQEISRFLKDVS